MQCQHIREKKIYIRRKRERTRQKLPVLGLYDTLARFRRALFFVDTVCACVCTRSGKSRTFIIVASHFDCDIDEQPEEECDKEPEQEEKCHH